MDLPRSRSRTLTALTLALLIVCSTFGVAMTPGEEAVAAARPTLSVSPGVYVGGQRLTWSGSVGHPGERPLVLQLNMGSVVGGQWETVEGFSARTRADGSFSFSYPAPSMFNVRYRVKAGSYVSPPQVFNAKTQDLTIRLTRQRESSTNAPGAVAPGERFGITVDTTPDDIFRSPESRGLPVFAGRDLTLQRRVDGRTWRTVATSHVGADGAGGFAGLAEPAGIAVYRVRAEDYVTDGNRIGWVQSFPLYVLVGDEAQRWYAGRYGANDPRPTPPAPPKVLGAQPSTASQRFQWFPSVFDFAWEHGQSLDSPPARGTRLEGSWSDFSSGSGRVQKYNGGLALDSKRYAGAGTGDFGTTRAIMHGNAMTYGRWETSLRIRNAFERGGRDYKVLAELVPADPAEYDCGRHDITIAQISPFSRTVRFGARSGANHWAGRTTAAYPPLANAYDVAVEVTPEHLTWFLNGSPVGSVRTSAAVPGVPMTLRLSLEGHRRAEMNQVSLISDWQRGFPMTTGQQAVSPRELSRSGAPAARCRPRVGRPRALLHTLGSSRPVSTS